MSWSGFPHGGSRRRLGRESSVPSAVVPLVAARAGQMVLVVDLPGRGGERLLQMGLSVGATAQVISGDGRGPVVIAVGDTRLALGRRAARRVLVEILTS